MVLWPTWVDVNTASGSAILTLGDPANCNWNMNAYFTNSDDMWSWSGGYKSLSAALTQLSVITSDTYSAGSISVMYLE